MAKNIRPFKLLVLLLLIVFSLSVVCDMKGFLSTDTSVDIEVTEGATLDEITQQLKENKIIMYPFIFKAYSKITNSTKNLKFGIHTLEKNMSYSEILDTLSSSADINGTALIIPEGYELWQIAKKCEEVGLCTEQEFLNECEISNFDYDFLDGTSLEGYLFPASYMFPSSADAHDIIDAMLKKFDSVYTDDYKAKANELNLKTDEVITLASIIEREGASEDEFKKVSAVFHNRLKKGMRLESCATIQYILKERKDVLSVADTKIDSPYNTYMYAGLPKGAIASPGKAAIEAALFPDDNDYLYFLANDGKSVFSRTFSEHQQAMKEAGL